MLRECGSKVPTHTERVALIGDGFSVSVLAIQPQRHTHTLCLLVICLALFERQILLRQKPKACGRTVGFL